MQNHASTETSSAGGGKFFAVRAALKRSQSGYARMETSEVSWHIGADPQFYFTSSKYGFSEEIE